MMKNADEKCRRKMQTKNADEKKAGRLTLLFFNAPIQDAYML
jgi:hypothetical protein